MICNKIAAQVTSHGVYIVLYKSFMKIKLGAVAWFSSLRCRGTARCSCNDCGAVDNQNVSLY